MTFAGTALICVLFGIIVAARTITLTNSEIVDRGLLYRRRIPFDQIISVATRMVDRRGTVTATDSSYEISTIKGTHQTIKLAEWMIDYNLIIDYIQSRMDERETPADLT